MHSHDEPTPDDLETLEDIEVEELMRLLTTARF
jgi:hypothetical protein